MRDAYLCCNEIISEDIDINIKNNNNNTPFHYSLIFGNKNISILYL